MKTLRLCHNNTDRIRLEFKLAELYVELLAESKKKICKPITYPASGNVWNLIQQKTADINDSQWD